MVRRIVFGVLLLAPKNDSEALSEIEPAFQLLSVRGMSRCLCIDWQAPARSTAANVAIRVDVGFMEWVVSCGTARGGPLRGGRGGWGSNS